MIAKALERPPESIAARWGAVAVKVNLLHHANSAVEWKTLANHKSNAQAALRWFRGGRMYRHAARPSRLNGSSCATA